MAQTSVASYFNNRKRAAASEELIASRNKVFLLDSQSNGNNATKLIEQVSPVKVVETPRVVKSSTLTGKNVKLEKRKIITRRTTRKPAVDDSKKQEKIVNFFKMGMLSPRKHLTPTPIEPTRKPSMNLFSSLESLSNSERGMKTPTKGVAPVDLVVDSETTNKTEISIENVKKNLLRSKRLPELKASLKRIQDLDRKLLKTQEAQKTEDAVETKTLKEFKTIEVEILR